MDVIGQFVAECLAFSDFSVGADLECRPSERVRGVVCNGRAKGRMSARALALRLQEHGLESYKAGGVRGWAGAYLVDRFHTDESEHGTHGSHKPEFPVKRLTSDSQGVHTGKRNQVTHVSHPETWTGPQKARFEELRRRGMTSAAAAAKVVEESSDA